MHDIELKTHPDNLNKEVPIRPKKLQSMVYDHDNNQYIIQVSGDIDEDILKKIVNLIL